MSTSTAIWALAVPIVYTFCGLVIARLIAGHLAWRMHTRDRYTDHESPSGDQWLGASVMGLLAGAIWPLVILYRCVSWQRFAAGAEAKAVAKQSRERIAELEKGLDDD